MKNKVRDSGQLAWTNGTGSAVVSGQCVPLTAYVGIAVDNIAAAASGVLNTSGVYTLAKEPSLAISQNAKVYWDATNSRITTTSSGNTLAGRAAAAALAADTTVDVDINVGAS